MILREYQKEAIQSIYDYFAVNDGNPLVVLPTGTGKSMVLGEFIRSAITDWPDTRIIVGTHSKELVEQDYLEFINLFPFADAGICSAGLRRKDTDHQVLFCGIQSSYKKAYEFQRCDILIIDEAQSVPQDGEGMWLQFIGDLLKINPDMRVVGLTATDYRLKDGLLTTGDNPIFTDVCYRYELLRAIEEGYLCPIVPKSMATKFDLSGVGTLGGDYKQGELERAVNVDPITKAALDEVELYGRDRKTWLLFAAGNDHARAIHDELKARGYIGEVVTQETDRAVRDKAVVDIKSGKIRYIVNNKIFTTGTNIPRLDMIADLGPTKSPGLHVQKLGRSMRPLYAPGYDLTTIQGRLDAIANGPKPNALLLDFSKNNEYFGPLDKIKGKDKRKGSGDGDAPIKSCPQCHEVVFAGLRVCFRCGFEFPAPELDIRSTAGNAPILSSQIEPEWMDVLGMRLAIHLKDGGKHPVMKVEYTTLTGRVREWICFEHPRGGRARRKAEQWHMGRLYMMDVPEKIEDAIKLPYPVPKRIKVVMRDKWPEVLDWDFRGVDSGAANKDNDVDTFEIPF